MRRTVTISIYGISALIGVAAFTYPLFLPQIQQNTSEQPSVIQGITSAPVLTTLLLLVCLAVLLVEVHGQAVSAKVVAALGVLVAVASVLRFLETAIPGPGGFSPVFVPIILAGYVFGARFGLLMGAMTLLVSALLTGGAGPWLPYQMFAAAWVGMTAGWLPKPANDRVQRIILTAFAFAWGLLFGAILNLYFWPFVSGNSTTNWQAGISLAETAGRYLAFYLSTSFIWDLARGLGNAALVLALGVPVVRALQRFKDRFQFELA